MTLVSCTAHLLSGEVHQAYYALSEEEAGNYSTFKDKILARCRLSSIQAAAEFQPWAYQPSKEPQGQMDARLCFAQRWVQPDQLSLDEIVEHVTLDKFL